MPFSNTAGYYNVCVLAGVLGAMFVLCMSRTCSGQLCVVIVEYVLGYTLLIHVLLLLSMFLVTHC